MVGPAPGLIARKLVQGSLQFRRKSRRVRNPLPELGPPIRLRRDSEVLGRVLPRRLRRQARGGAAPVGRDGLLAGGGTGVQRGQRAGVHVAGDLAGAGGGVRGPRGGVLGGVSVLGGHGRDGWGLGGDRGEGRVGEDQD